MRSCDSDRKISHGCRPGYFSGTFSSQISAPPASGASSPMDDDRPPAPSSVAHLTSPRRQATSRKSESIFCVMGLPICTALRGECLSRPSEENVAPWMPSLPVRPPASTTRSPGAISFSHAGLPP